MKKTIVSTILVLALLAITAGIVYAVWQDTQSTQVTATVLPAPEGTFQITDTFCADTVVGSDANCFVEIQNESYASMTVDAMVIVPDPFVVVRLKPNVIGQEVDPQDFSTLAWNYTPMVAGEVAFDVEITCSGE